MNPEPAPASALARPCFPPLQRGTVEVLQVNLGRLCNQACRHCHVDSSPARGGPEDNAGPELLEEVLALLEAWPALRTLDLTGGAPELHPGFRGLVRAARGLGRTVFVRHNLTVQEEPDQEDLPAFFAGQGVVLFCSLPCYLPENVDLQRGRGVFEKSLRALRRLNEAGFGRGDGGRELHLVYNPLGPSLPPPQERLEENYREALSSRYGITFDRLITITNQPIHRFREDLERQGRLEDYYRLLEENFNSATLPHVMCRGQLSVRWDGRLYDCDFNLVLDLPLRDRGGRPLLLTDLLVRDPRSLEGLPIAVARHCFACTAGAGSSCGGSLVEGGA